jgi:hypothetical protein
LIYSTGRNKSFVADLQSIYEKYLPLTEGRTTNILAHLKEADPNTFALSPVSIDGNVHSVGILLKRFPSSPSQNHSCMEWCWKIGVKNTSGASLV